ncbi:hemolysin type calcium-binding protein [Pacificibacter maritimus]|uniref:Hemolysin type calcium-binding protein n=1 Tax=Pacificibacter maritimus TaxID=762213 RepID=A0A3N4UPQ4_9RHOB|nr:Hint domain-containing protein [Pacificibacter maritimus]RPE66987.1 hemolysin type calcium-binding protein [Pacificibacter maritimus]
MPVTANFTDQLYSYSGDLVSLLNVSVLPNFSGVAGGNISLTDNDGVLTPNEASTIVIDGSPENVTYVGVATFNGSDGGLIGGVLGGLLGSTEAAIFETASGELYLYAPDGFPALAGVAVGITVDQGASYSLSATTPGIVDGTDDGEVMNVGYTDADGDEITNYNAGGLFGGYQSGDDVIYGNGGDDTINAGSGNDVISGGEGNDTIDGQAGNDTISGDAGDDTIYGGAGNDVIGGGEGNDIIFGGAGNDTIYGGAGNDIITGGDGADIVYGGDGNDVWLSDGETSTSSSASDEVYLEGGDDYAQIGYFTVGTPDILDGGEGNDTVALDNALVNTLDTGITLNDDGTSTTINFGTIVNNFENVRGSAGENAITGNNLDNIIWGLGGNDTLDGGGGNDTIEGGAGADNMSGGDGNDRFIIGSAADANGDVIVGGSGVDDTTDIDVIDLSAIDRSTYTITASVDPNDSGAKTGTVNFDTGETLSFSGIELICFARGSEIITSNGPVNVEDLEVGCMVLTMDNGMQPLRWIGSTKLDSHALAARPKFKPIKISAGALGNGTPMTDLMVSRQHRILVRSAIAERMFGVPEILVAAIKLVELPGIEIVEDAENVEYFHILFDEHEIVFSNGAATESLFTGPEALKAVTEDARAEIIELFPDIETQTALISARYIPPKGSVVKRFVERHAKNNKALMC